MLLQVLQWKSFVSRFIMSRYKDYLLEFSDKYNPNDINWLTDINNKILSKLFGKSKRIKIDTYDQFVFMWNFVMAMRC